MKKSVLSESMISDLWDKFFKAHLRNCISGGIICLRQITFPRSQDIQGHKFNSFIKDLHSRTPRFLIVTVETIDDRILTIISDDIEWVDSDLDELIIQAEIIVDDIE